LSWYICTRIQVKLARDSYFSPNRLHFFGILRDIGSTSGHKQHEWLYKSQSFGGLARLTGSIWRSFFRMSQQWAGKEWLGRQPETK